ncbi:MAG: menaquinone biosynthesis protein [Deltaproteobacteria bacterium]|nr:menaquinone biosynthesis protein [Deltaproteobacteria bacterium]
MLRVGLVSFFNAWPLYQAFLTDAIKTNYDFTQLFPSECAEMLRNKEIDIGIVPAIEYAYLPHQYIILPSMCISSPDYVRSVALFCNTPFNKVRKVLLDKYSRTSNALAQILLKEKFKKDVECNFNMKDFDAQVIIGDNALFKEKEFPSDQILDLAHEWKTFTNLPFVFALWVGYREKITNEVVQNFTRAKEWGITHIEEIACCFHRRFPYLTKQEYINYLTSNINYHLTEEKIESIQLFLNLCYKSGFIPKMSPLHFF